MPRIKLAGWYGERKPGDELDVGDVLLKALRRDGLVAEVVDDGPVEAPAAATEEQPEAAITEEPERAASSGRKRR